MYSCLDWCWLAKFAEPNEALYDRKVAKYFVTLFMVSIMIPKRVLTLQLPYTKQYVTILLDGMPIE